MSNASTPLKVVRTALGRVQKGWTQGLVYSGPMKGQWKGDTVKVCLNGGLHGYQGQKQTNASMIAADAVLEAINELYWERAPDGKWSNIPTFNDAMGANGTTFEMVEKVLKLAIIKLETGWKPPYVRPDPTVTQDTSYGRMA